MSCCDQDHEGHNHDRRPQQQTIDGLAEQQRARLKQQRKEKRRAEMLEHKKKYLPLLKFLKSNGLKFKSAAVKKKSVEYFRIDQFRGFLKAKKDQIEQNQSIKDLLRNWQKIFLYYQRVENQPNLKWPQHLEQIKFSPQCKFASFPFDSSESSKISTFLIIAIVVALVLFPLWPFELKYFLWKAMLYILIAFVALTVIRLILYMIVAVFGVSFWIFPRLFENTTTLETFKPFYSVSKWEGSSASTVVTRFLVLSIIVYYGYHIYSDPNLVKENFDITNTIIDDIDGWGIAKIKGQKNFSQSALTDYSKLLNKTLNEADHDEIRPNQPEIQV